jgi:hypothetical protein
VGRRTRCLGPGLFRAGYSGEINPQDPDKREIHDFHVGTDAAGVKHWVEEMAAGLGYERVAVWDSD